MISTNPPTLPLPSSTPAVADRQTVTLTARVFEPVIHPPGPRLPASLQVSIVTFKPDLHLLERCCRKLALAVAAAREDGVVRTVALAIIDNSGERAIAKEVIAVAQAP